MTDVIEEALCIDYPGNQVRVRVASAGLRLSKTSNKSVGYLAVRGCRAVLRKFMYVMETWLAALGVAHASPSNHTRSSRADGVRSPRRARHAFRPIRRARSHPSRSGRPRAHAPPNAAAALSLDGLDVDSTSSAVERAGTSPHSPFS